MYAVIDTETTGLSLSNDRIIELAVIGLDADGEKEWEWCSLINPERNTGHGMAVRIHQIYSSDVADAPTFSEFAGHIADILQGRAVIAHNAKFDLGMLGAEFKRWTPASGQGIGWFKCLLQDYCPRDRSRR